MKPLTPEQADVVSAYTGVLVGSFSSMHAYIERILGRSVWTHELADKDVWREIKEAAHDDFLALVPPETR